MIRLAFVTLAAALVGASASPGNTLSQLLLSSFCKTEIEAAPTAAQSRPTMVSGFGSGAMDISANAEAKRWFDYGLQNAWAFNHAAAVAAFVEAQRLDPACAMCIWGEAWSGGPTINFPVDEATANGLLERVRAAEALATNESATNKALIDALRVRYSGNLNRRSGAFADAMVALANQTPNDDTLQVLAADAEMIADRAPEQAMSRLEQVLARAPEHTGAIHFYIHSAEWAGQNEKAEPYADRLGALAPAASHLIHMPSHTYYRLGRYREAGVANLEAVRADQRYLRDTSSDMPLEEVPYHSHNVHFGMGGAMMAGDGDLALELARHYESTWTKPVPEADYREVLKAAALLAQARYGEPAELLALAEPSGGAYLRGMWRYARGEALARQGDAAAVEREARAMQVEMRGFNAYGRRASNTRALVSISRDVLLGRAALLRDQPRDAHRYFQRAARLQERTFDGGDPPLFWYPVRRSAALALLEAGRAREAAIEARKVLEDWPNDPMTLVVLARAERSLGNAAAADAHSAAAQTGWAGDLGAVNERLI